jgi:probable F420-dependent oxidoreductase
MTDPARWGITVPFDNVPLHEHPRLYSELADAGYTDLWSLESDGADVITPLALAASDTRLRLGTAIVSAYTRGPAVIAQTAAAMADAAPGRFALGIGASSNVLASRWNGIAFDRPLQRVRDLVRFLRAALRGDKVEQSYETFSIKGFRLSRVPSTPPPLLVAALRPQMLRLAGEEADGVILNWLSARDVEKVVPIVRDANAAAEVVARIMVCPSEDADAVRALVRPFVTGYLTVPVYRKYHEWLGRSDVLGPMWRAWEAGERRQALACVPDDLVDELCIHGSPEYCRARVRDYVERGVTTPVLAVLVPPGGDLRAAVMSLARPASAAQAEPAAS